MGVCAEFGCLLKSGGSLSISFCLGGWRHRIVLALLLEKKQQSLCSWGRGVLAHFDYTVSLLLPPFRPDVWRGIVFALF